MNTAPINIFQKLMRKWEAVHPYNAAQVMKIAGQPNTNALQASWNDALAATGLGRIAREGKRYHFESLNGHAKVYGVAFPTSDLETHLSTELNHAFDDPDEPPFRPFIISDDNHFYAGLIYQHWIADSAAIRMLLREWFVRTYDPSSARRSPLRLPTGGYWDMVGPGPGGWNVGGSTVAMIRRHARLRRVQKIDSASLVDHTTRFEFFETPPGTISHLKDYAKSKNVKLNDVFLAALAEACAKHVPLQPRAKRTDVAVGSIADLRPYCPNDLSDTFGLFLGFTNVVCQPNELQDFDLLLKAVSIQTQNAKETGVAPSSLMWMSAAILIGSFSKPQELYHFYRKELPLAGGISNVDLTRCWVAQYPSLVTDYIRVSPTGPMTPLVVTTTTMGDAFNIGMTYRTGLISPQRASAISSTLIERLTALEPLLHETAHS